MRAINIETAKRLLEVVDCGLTNGLGVREPGKMCVEAAVCYALDLPHGDNPECVAPSVRSFKIVLNDGPWSSNTARAKGLRALAVAQLGTKDAIDEIKFATAVSLGVVREILPPTLEIVAALVPSHKAPLLAAAKLCREAETLSAASAASDAASYAARAASAASDAASYAARAARAASYAASAASAASDAASDAADSFLTLGAAIALQALRGCGATGVDLLDKINAGAA